MKNTELLKLAAKAAGYDVVFIHDESISVRRDVKPNGRMSPWNPIYSDGDALRLAVALDMDIAQMVSGVKVAECLGIDNDNSHMVYEKYSDHDGDKLAATRLAIVKCAAEICKGSDA